MKLFGCRAARWGSVVWPDWHGNLRILCAEPGEACGFQELLSAFGGWQALSAVLQAAGLSSTS